MSYVADHADALREVQAAGAALTFFGIDSSGAADTVAGYAVQVRGDPEQYRALSLIESEAPTFLFVPTTYGDLPGVGYTGTWGGTVYTVKGIYPVAPDGTAIMARLIVQR